MRNRAVSADAFRHNKHWCRTRLYPCANFIHHFILQMLQRVKVDSSRENDRTSTGENYIHYCTDHNLFKTTIYTPRIYIAFVRELLCGVDGAVLIVFTETVLQRLASCFVEATKLFALEISIQKAGILHQSMARNRIPSSIQHHTKLNTLNSSIILIKSFLLTPRLPNRLPKE